jgi:hypothetical protein
LQLTRPLPIPLNDLFDATLETSPDGRWILLNTYRTQESTIQQLAWRLGIQFGDEMGPIEYRLFDSRSSQELTGFSIRQRHRTDSMSRGALTTFWDGKGRTLAVCEPGSQFAYQIYDIPPRKSLTWFAGGAAPLALPIAFLAWRRTRKLRAA